METLLSILKKTTGYFEKFGIENPRLDAELLIAHVLHCKRMQLYLDFEKPMSEAVLDALRPLMKRRANREPLQYILGTESFMDFELKVDRRALIPRPETEELIEHITPREQQLQGAIRILDLGTGTGAIAIALARAYSQATVIAADISSDTLDLARENIVALGLSDRIQLIQSDWYTNVKGSFDLIVSNPPYLSEEELKTAAPEVSAHEPVGALVAGPKGMECIEVLIGQSPQYLKPGGAMYLETGAEQSNAIHGIVAALPALTCEILKDLSGKHRFVRLTLAQQ